MFLPVPFPLHEMSFIDVSFLKSQTWEVALDLAFWSTFTYLSQFPPGEKAFIVRSENSYACRGNQSEKEMPWSCCLTLAPLKLCNQDPICGNQNLTLLAHSPVILVVRNKPLDERHLQITP